ncbi:MAG: response regulator transcription factor [Sandaracinaceae bacterium]|nr:response regulator transcription factor [Sandaracinaceae bacterium]
MIRLLLIDDDKRLFELLEGYLAQNGVTLTYAPDGKQGLDLLRPNASTSSGNGFDAVLLDVMMPQIDGLEVLRRIRLESNIPVLMLTARGDETDRVVGLELGADDYVAKPFGPRELLARIRAVLRRAAPDTTGERLSAAGITADVGTREVIVDGKAVELTGLEFDILAALLRRAGRVIPRNALLAEAGRDDVVVGERTVDVHISRLRKKIGDDDQARIKTVRGVGYVLSKDGTVPPS